MCARLCLLLVISASPLLSIPPDFEEVVDEWQEDDSQLLRIHVVFDRTISNRPDWQYVQHTFVWPAIGYWNRTLQVRQRSSVPILKKRDCVGSTVRVFDNETEHPIDYCYHSCAITTMCGLLEVPAVYLAPCHRCTERSREGSGGKCWTESSELEASAVIEDYLLFVHSSNDSNCVAPARAASTSCQLDPVTDRPVIGVVNICPQALNVESGLDEKAVSEVIKHELAHVLGFAESLFPFYRDRAGNPLVQRDSNGEPIKNRPNYLSKVKKQVTREWESAVGVFQRKMTLVVLPTVVREVRAHFGCMELEGAELENQGDDTLNSHWEKRIFVNELMASTYSESAYVSRITLALLQDTGWYNVRMRMAEKFEWGQGLGCDFATRSCYTYMQKMKKKGLSIAPYCDYISMVDNELRTSCDAKHVKPVFCNLRKYPIGEIKPMFQYFGGRNRSEMLGGLLPSADYCPFFQQLIRKRVRHGDRWRFLHCKDSSLQQSPEANNASETFGPASLCLPHVTPFSRAYQNARSERTVTSRSWGSGCYQVTCGASHVTVHFASGSVQCLQEFEPQPILEHFPNHTLQGTVLCPGCAEACPSSPCPMSRAPVACPESRASDRCQTFKARSVHTPDLASHRAANDAEVDVEAEAASLGPCLCLLLASVLVMAFDLVH